MDEVFYRLDGETDEDLIYRIGTRKTEVGTWDEVRDLLNNLLGENHGESYYRKKIQGTYDKKYDKDKTKSNDLENEENQIGIKGCLDDDYKFRIEKIKVQTLNRERNAYDRNIARHQLFYEQIGDATKKIPVPEFYPILEPDDNSIEYLVTIADVHYGATFECDTNKYSREIVEEKFGIMLFKIIEFVESKNLSHINICSLGDSIQGILRCGDLKVNDTAIPVAIVEYCHLMASFLTELSKYVNVTFYTVTRSNHTQIRPLGVKATELMDEDLEYVISNYIYDLVLHNKRIEVVFPRNNSGILNFDINTIGIVAMHGNQMKDKKNALSVMRSFYDSSSIDVVLMGHYHSSYVFDSNATSCGNTEVIVCPSFIGSDPYSESLFKTSNGSFQILGFDDIYGHTETYRFYV